MGKDLKEEELLTRRWLKGIPYEIAFWRSYYRNRKSRRMLFEWSDYGKECRLDMFDITSYIAGLDHKPVIADVGCALSYVLGNMIGGVEHKIIYMDPLALFYNKILSDYNVERPRITFGLGEMLTMVFAPESVDFIHIRNALDHSSNPMYVIWQALASIRTGGVLYLHHKPDEAEHEAYMGFHQYNVTSLEGRLTIWNRSETFDIGAELSGYATVETSVTEEGFIVGVIRKTASIPSDLPVLVESQKYGAMMLAITMDYMNSTWPMICYHIKKALLMTGHALMRLLPVTAIRKIKRLIKK